MSTTLLFAELLIAGFEVVVWFVILVFTVFGYDWVFKVQTQIFSDWQILISVVALAFVYVLGILFDRFADMIFSKWDRAISKRIFGEEAAIVFAVKRFQISKENEYLHYQFEYTRSRQRIARASALNFAITTVLAFVFVATRLQGSSYYATLLWFIAIVGIFLTVLAIITWYKLINSYCKLIKISVANRKSCRAAQQRLAASRLPRHSPYRNARQ
jgi:hypothetical protein